MRTEVSWWIGLSRAEFNARAHAEAPRLRASGASVVFATTGDALWLMSPQERRRRVMRAKQARWSTYSTARRNGLMR